MLTDEMFSVYSLITKCLKELGYTHAVKSSANNKELICFEIKRHGRLLVNKVFIEITEEILVTEYVNLFFGWLLPEPIDAYEAVERFSKSHGIEFQSVRYDQMKACHEFVIYDKIHDTVSYGESSNLYVAYFKALFLLLTKRKSNNESNA